MAWSRQFADTYDVATVRVTRDGLIAGDPISMTSTGDNEESPRTAFDGQRFFVVWTSGRSIEGAFVDPATGDASASLMISTSDELEGLLRPQIAWNGATYLIAWSVGVTSPANLRVVGTRLSVTGEIVDGDPVEGGGFRVPTSSEAQAITGVDWDGRDFLVSWNEGFFGPCNYDPCPPPSYRMNVSRVGSDGHLRTRNASMLGNGVLQSHASTLQRKLFAYESNERQWLRLSQPRGRAVRR